MKLKKLVSLLLAGIMVVSLAACTPPAEGPNGSEGDSQIGEPVLDVQNGIAIEAITSFTQAPNIKSTAAVTDRLPKAADVFVEVIDSNRHALEIGNYGGDINLVGTDNNWEKSRYILETIIHYNNDGTYYPNVVKSIEHSDDYRVWTFKLREGMKWSDGEAFNADDITFWYYMVHLSNFDTKRDGWSALTETVDGKTAYPVLKKVNDYEVTWTFVNPKYPSQFIQNGDFKWCWAPEHYLNDLIPASMYYENEYWPNTNLTDEEAKANAIKKGVTSDKWKDIGRAFSYYWWNTPGLPTLNAWVLSTAEGVNNVTGALCIYERNEYFWKVDANGQQLPYVDNLKFNKYETTGLDLLAFRSGELDTIGIEMKDISQTIADAKGNGYDVELRTILGTSWGSYQVTFNQTCTDAKYQELFANVKFREAISICVNREEASKLLTKSFLKPGQCTPQVGAFGYDKEWAEKWTEYNVEKAKTLLQECGLVLGSDGKFDFADGTDVLLQFYYFEGAEDMYTVLSQYYEAAGLSCAGKQFTRDAYDQEIDNNTWWCSMGPSTSIGSVMADRPAPLVPVAQAAEWYSDYGLYYATNGASGTKPTGDMAKLVELYEQWTNASDGDEQAAIELKIYEIHKNNMWSIAYLESQATYTLVNSKLGNYPDNTLSIDKYMYGNINHFWTIFKAQ